MLTPNLEHHLDELKLGHAHFKDAILEARSSSLIANSKVARLGASLVTCQSHLLLALERFQNEARVLYLPEVVVDGRKCR